MEITSHGFCVVVLLLANLIMKGRSWPVVLTFFFGVLSTVAQAQRQKEIDSLNRLLRTYSQNDSNRLKLYGELSWLYATTRSQTNTAKKYADSIHSLALALNDPRGVALAQFYYGGADRFERNFSDGIRHLNAFIQFQVQDGDSAKVAMGLFQLGAIYLAMDDVEKGLKALYRALAIHEKESDPSGANFVLNAIGTVLKNSRRYDEAIQVYNKVLSTDSLDSDVLMNLGNVYAELKEYDETLKNYKKALKVDMDSEQNWAIAYDLAAIGELFNTRQLYDSALQFHLRALAIREGLPDKNERGISLSQVGLTYAYLGEFQRAEKLLLDALAIANAIQLRSLKRDTYEKLAILHERKNEVAKSYDYFKKFTAVKDSLLNEESVRQINELKTRFETAKKDHQIELLSKENEVNIKERERLSVVKNSVLTGIVLIGLLAGLIVYVLLQRLRNQKLLTAKNNEVKEAQFKNQLSELKMKALQAQINPHFIFNCMNSINQMIVDGDNDRASLYLSKLSRLIRLILENSDSTEVSLKDEIALLESYIQLEELRFNGTIQYNLDTQEDLDPENTFLPFMVLQPFVENAIWHGLGPKGPNSKGRIDISIKQNEGLLVCQIEDNGIGRDKALELQKKSVWKTRSMGLKITEERLGLINKELKRQLIHITDLKDSLGHALGTRVEVTIPIL